MATLADYGTALELAFDANLLVAAWATLYNLFNTRFKALSDDADRFEQEPLLEEEISIEALKNTIAFWSRLRTVLWWAGFLCCTLSAVNLYVYVWQALPPTTVWTAADVNWFTLQAWAGPALMAAMAVVGLAGSKLASNKRDALERQRKRKAATRDRKLRDVRRTAEGIAQAR